ncbi:hypothetical protein MIND_00956000 [Mycena indigotica]|uniref:Pali-domain-containing protein n=1 Tax=Mycena indigotica TaxID=2126181 RepID=A0A8H6SD40_9AGAR|nr:uncharacterized protein MIND_00956000 [Mycena indigotica]KAF7297229.1 hypothetical protein MIND_00956000 [Mycena indigotica]
MFALHVGTFLIFAAFALLIVASISAPTVAKIDFLHVPLNNGSSVRFGSLGFCIMSPDGNSCTPTGVGYRIANEISAIGIDAFNSAQAATLHGLTQALILHQIAAGVSGIALLLALGSHRIGFLFASAVAFLAFLIATAVMIIDFTLFGTVKHHVDRNGGSATFGNAIWMVLAAAITLFFASIATCFACITGRRRTRRTRAATGTY